MNEAKIFRLLNLLKNLTFDSRFSFAVEEHCNHLSLVNGHALGGSKEAEGVELSLQGGKSWSKESYIIGI